MLRLMSAQSILYALTDGAMRALTQDLSIADKTRIAEHLADQRLSDLPDKIANAKPVACTGEAARFDMGAPPVWPGWGLTRSNTRHIDASTTSINRSNVENLKLKWAFTFPEALRVRSQPALAGGALIVGSHNGRVYALDEETACVRWSFQATADVRNGIVVSPWQPGDTDAQPLAFFGDLLGYVYAVDARSGELVWRDRPDSHPNATMTGAPTLYNDTLFVPVSSLEVISTGNPKYVCCTFRGSVVAYQASTGQQLWQTYSVAEAPAPKGVTSAGTTRLGPSGAPIWNSPAVDEARGQILFGTGENYSSPATGTSDSIFAVDMQTGAVNWVFQGTEGDAWNSACSRIEKGPNCPEEDGPDVDFGAGATLATTSSGRDLVVAGQKSGNVFAIDPASGKQVWKTRVGRGSLSGGVHFGLAIAGDRVYVPIADLLDGSDFPGERHPGLHALDLETGKILWRSPMEDRCNGRDFCVPGISVAATATDDLVFAGGLDGWMRIYDAATGAVLWEYDTTASFTGASGPAGSGGAIGGGAAAIAHGDTLYVSSGYGFAGMMPGNVLLAFELEGP
ncbi:MAG: PQQ-binding-like beta-propeller repeat protein [Gammaproteobacteria bacterium]|nr:PQQ-binding-like beta-propeller repeat protein [Gammaproteobacteria bacterium]